MTRIVIGMTRGMVAMLALADKTVADKLAAFHMAEIERWGALMRAAKVEPQ